MLKNHKKIIIIIFLSLHSVAFSKENINSDTEVQDFGITVIKGKSDDLIDNELKQQGLNVDVIKILKQKNTNKNVNKILNNQSGINIRQAGGLGSESKVSLNGISGNNVRYFVDGIPVEDFGSSVSITNLPISLIDEIEVYKGVVSIEFGADALGGAINIKTNQDLYSYLDASVSYGSFNTSHITLNSQYTTDTDYFLRINGVTNYSDNSFLTKNVPQMDELGNFESEFHAERFNDQYRSSMLNMTVGVADKSFADELTAKVQYAHNKNNLQHPLHSINLIFGELYTENNTWQISSHYKKEWNDWLINAYVLKGYSIDDFFDIANEKYDWAGNVTSRPKNQGEYGAQSHYISENDIVKGSLLTEYTFNENNKMVANYTFNRLNNDARDEINLVNNLFIQPNQLDKSVIGLAHHWNKDNKNATIFYKNYDYRAQLTNKEYQAGGDRAVSRDIRKNKQGYGLYGSYRIKPTVLLNSSYERAYRLPAPHEILGDGNKFVRSNPLLDAEQSDNVNVGILTTYKDKLTKITINAEANTFYRNVDGYIQFYPDRIVQGIYRNLNDVEISGIELSTDIIFDKKYSFKTNLTSQGLIDKSKLTSSGLINRSYNTDIPNQPKLFANMSFGYQKNMQDRFFSTYVTNHFVGEFPLLETTLGKTGNKKIIPNQISSDLEFTFTEHNIFNEGSMHLGLTFENITNADLYDNYKIQKAGRAYYAKARYVF